MIPRFYRAVCGYFIGVGQREGDHGRLCLQRAAKRLAVSACGMWLIAKGRLVSLLTTSMSRLTAAALRNSDPMRPSPPSLFDPPPLKWSDLRYVFDIQEDFNGKEAKQA
jgi:hypothetical protein